MNKTETDPEMIRIGKAAAELTKTWPITIILISLFFPLFAKRFADFAEAMSDPISRGKFGTDEELGL